jgi:DNA-binding SARP family transcriptional activator
LPFPRQGDGAGLTTDAGAAPLLRMRLLGKFEAEVERAGVVQAVSSWQRRSAKALTKLLAIYPRHALHRDQILEILWPGADIDSALNSFGKALHAARHAFEPSLPPRKDSAYLRLTETMVELRSEHVEIDVDRFEQLADHALRSREVTAYEAALAAYGGELLPEDRYAEWCIERRGSLTDLYVRLLLGVAEVLKERGAYNAAADHLRAALSHDPMQETVHRRLMRLYAEMGTPDQAIRQFHLCKEVLRRELELEPQRETVSLYQGILGNRVPDHSLTSDPDASAAAHIHQPAPAAPRALEEPASRRPFVGRERVLSHLCAQLARGTDRQACMMLVTGEPGVGKTRLLEEFAARARRQGAAVLCSGRGAHAKQFACGLFAVALEGYAAALPESERSELEQRYPALARFVPSLRPSGKAVHATAALPDYYLDLMPAIARLLTDLSRNQPVLIVLGDLHEADRYSLDLITYLTHLAARQPWLMVGAVRDGEIATNAELARMIEATMRDRLCLRIGLSCLSRRDCDDLVRELLPGPQAGDAFLEQIYVSSGGNPLFVEEIIGEFRQRGGGLPTLDGQDESPGAAVPVPVRLRTFTAMRLAAMDETLRQVLRLAAASAMREISLAQLRTGAAALTPPISDSALFDALDRALEMRVLVEHAEGYVFRHPLIRLAIGQTLARHRRDQLRAALNWASTGCEPASPAVSPAG